jgi:hypothetical protein
MPICGRCGDAWLEGETHLCGRGADHWTTERLIVAGAFAGALPGVVLMWLTFLLTSGDDGHKVELAAAALTVPVGVVVGIVLALWRARRRKMRFD